MSADIFEELALACVRYGEAPPSWVRQKKVPQIKAQEYGDKGPRILLFHGLLGAMSNWDTLIPFLVKFSRPINFYFPILTAHRSEVRVKALALLAEYYLREKKLGPVVLCGNSLGGHVAQRLCLASPELTHSLILSGTSGLYEHTVDNLPVRPDRNYIREHMGRVFFQREFVTEDRIEEVYKILQKKLNVLNVIHAARSAKRDNLAHLLPQINKPTLLLWGEDDQVTTMAVANLFKDGIPNSKLVSIKNCGHAPMIEYPEWFADQIRSFLEENPL
ncbi:MAG TPA: alpha/beta hydrolase [Oligoflexia bacterium]|nr:alpha/beta hydrolase [Oligoflexia bacterium]HMP26799.1 alpha/beta hydrolase [Oligoflexia bacterium]